MSEPVYRVTRREDGVRPVTPVERQRLLTPAEREEARRKREEARRRTAAKQTNERPLRNPPQGQPGGVDYTA
jgi:hypothetical protein